MFAKVSFRPDGHAREDCSLTHSYGEFGTGADGVAEREIYVEALRRLLTDVIAHRNDELAKKLYYLISSNQRDLGLALVDCDDDKRPFPDVDHRQRMAILHRILRSLPKSAASQPSGLQLRIDFLARSFGLAPHEAAILGILARREVFARWEYLLGKLERCDNMLTVNAFATILDLGTDDIYTVFSERGGLARHGIAESDHGVAGATLSLHQYIERFFATKVSTEAEMIRALMPMLSSPSLAAQDYGHMSGDLDRASRLIGHALASGERANVLLYGVPGTGKTEFARLLAAMHGASAVSVGEADDDGDEPTRRERLSHLRLCRKLAGKKNATVLVIDEAEDLFVGGVENRASKLWLNKLVEDGTGPHIWIVNHACLLGEPVIRRMDMAIRFDMPPAQALRSIVERLVKREGVALAIDEEEGKRMVSDLAKLGTSPAILSTAIRTGARVGESLGGVVNIARDLAEASGRTPSAGMAMEGAEFDPALSVANCDLVVLADKLVSTKSAWSLLLSGPSGTGKSAYARYLAARAGIDLHCVSGSELLGAYVGETEKQIAAAFAAAERHGSLLLIDEADSFLTNRDIAQRNWEVSMTNEMLRQMERGRVKFIATTNRAATLDPAGARRFVLHAEFTELDAARSRRLYEASFGAGAPTGLDRIPGLTPGDFAQVRQRAALLGETNPARLTDWLSSAVNAREGNKIKVGF